MAPREIHCKVFTPFNSAYWEIYRLFLLSADFIEKSTFSKNSFRNTISVTKFGSRSGPTFFWPDLGPNCLQRLSADDIIRQGVKPNELAYPYQ